MKSIIAFAFLLICVACVSAVYVPCDHAHGVGHHHGYGHHGLGYAHGHHGYGYGHQGHHGLDYGYGHHHGHHHGHGCAPRVYYHPEGCKCGHCPSGHELGYFPAKKEL